MSDQPEALLLADALTECHHIGVGGPDLQAAALLRRQHAEIERLYARQTDYEDAIASIKAERDALRTELLEVIEAMNDPAVKNIRTPVASIRILQAERDALRAVNERMLKATPPARRPLTDEEIDALDTDKDGLPNSHLEFARAIERAHGIGGNDE